MMTCCIYGRHFGIFLWACSHFGYEGIRCGALLAQCHRTRFAAYYTNLEKVWRRCGAAFRHPLAGVHEPRQGMSGMKRTATPITDRRPANSITTPHNPSEATIARAGLAATITTQLTG